MNMVNVAAHLQHALNLKAEDERLMKMFADWLPDEVIDAHAHCNLADHVQYVSDHAYGHMLSTFTHFSLDDSIRLRAVTLPWRRVRSLRFPKTFRGIDHREANDYLLNESPEEDRIAVFGLPEDFDYTAKIMQHQRATALKMYWSYVDPPAKKIYEYFTPEILEVAQDIDLPIILHLPRNITHTCEDLVQLLNDFPRLRVVLPHLALSKFVIPGLEEALRIAAKYENVWMDTALNPSADVVRLSLNCFGKERIMFGSDEPLNLIRSVAFVHPEKGERIATDYAYHWVDAKDHADYSHLAADAPHAHWQCLLALKDAFDDYTPAEQNELKELVFSKTAERFYDF